VKIREKAANQDSIGGDGVSGNIAGDLNERQQGVEMPDFRRRVLLGHCEFGPTMSPNVAEIQGKWFEFAKKFHLARFYR
jgi:hypothetical protein